MTLSEAERRASSGTVPASPRLGAAVRAALRDFLDHSWRLVALNLAWGAALLAMVAATTATPLAWLLAPLMALPTVGVYRVAALVVRDGEVSIREGFAAWARLGSRALVVGALLLLMATVLTTNIMGGLERRDVVGWSMATFAGWGLVATGVLATIVWPLLVDPLRSRMRLVDILRLTALLALAFPLRFGALLAVSLAILAVSTLAVVVVLTMAIGLSACVACRYVLPAADRFVARADGPKP